MPISAERRIFTLESADTKPTAKYRPLEGTDLGFEGAETQHATHTLHPYVAAINPPLVSKLLDVYVPRGCRVLDPFCGGGGVLVESLLRGHSAMGFDINPLAIVISNAKTTWIDRSRIQREYQRIIESTERTVGLIEPTVSEAARFWFKVETLPELAALSHAVRNTEDPDLKTLFSAILSVTVRSVMLTYRGEVRLRRLTGDHLRRFRPKTFEVFKQRSLIAAERVSQLPRDVDVKAAIADARNLPVDEAGFHSIICSPPYADDTNGVGYFQFSRYMLEWLGSESAKINESKRQFLGGSRSAASFPPSPTLQLLISKVRERSEKHYKDATSFYWDYYQSLAEMARVTTDWIIIVIGNRVLSRVLFDNARITYELFESVENVNFVDRYDRTIRKKRIPNLGTDGGGINVEHILVFRKK